MSDEDDNDGDLELWADDSPEDEADNELERLMEQRDAKIRAEAGGSDEEVDDDPDDDLEGDEEPHGASEGESEAEDEVQEPEESKPTFSTGDDSFWTNRYERLKDGMLAKELEKEEVKYEYDSNPATKRIMDMQVQHAAATFIKNEMDNIRLANEREDQAEKYLDKAFGDSWRSLGTDEEFTKWVEARPKYIRDVVAANQKAFTDVEGIADVIGQYLGERDTGGDVPDSGQVERSSKQKERPAKRTVRHTPGPSAKRASREKKLTGLEAAEAAGDPDDIMVELLKITPDSPLHGVWE